MKNNKKITLAAATFGIAALAMGGSTFAWFQVVNTANLAITGTVVAADNSLQVGFRTTSEIAGFGALGLVEDTLGLADEVTEWVYWAPNSVTADVMAAVIEASGYNADNILTPITSGSYTAGDPLDFDSKPKFSANRTDAIYDIGELAAVTEDDYVGFNIVFRSVDENEDGVNGQDIFFDVGTDLNGSDSVTDALRLGFDNGATTDIIHPTAGAASDIDVGGTLDLNGDGVFDYTLREYVLGEPQDVYEIAYGEFEETLVVPTNWGTTEGTAIAEPFSNTLFYDGDTGAGVLPLETATPLVAEYNILSAYQQAGTALATTATSGTVDGIAEITFLMWLEGWDHACVNSVANAALGASLTFIAPEA